MSQCDKKEDRFWKLINAMNMDDKCEIMDDSNCIRFFVSIHLNQLLVLYKIDDAIQFGIL